MDVAVYGLPESVYTRIVRLVLAIKQLPHELVVTDVFDPGTLPAGYAERHPFRRIPAVEIDGLRLYETDAIVHYLEAIRPLPPLIPAEPAAAARMRQIMRVVDNYAYRALVWGIYVPVWWREQPAPEPVAVVDADASLAALATLAAEARIESGVSLASLYLAATLAPLDSVAAGSALIDRHPRLRQWWSAFRGEPAMLATRSDHAYY